MLIKGTNMNYLILGLGSVGTILSCSLKLNKTDNIFGLKSKKIEDDFFNINVDVIENLKKEIKLSSNPVQVYKNQPIDYVFITTKSNYLKDMDYIFSDLRKQKPIVICLMNGMGYEGYFKGINTYYGIIMYNAFKKDDKVILGSKGGLILDKKLEKSFEGRFQTIPVSFVEDIERFRYRKIWLNTINGFLSIFGFSLFQYFEESKKLDNKPLKIFIDYLEETKKLFEILKIKTETLPSLDPDNLIKLMKKLLNKEKLTEKEEKLYNNLPKGKNSTLQSIERKEDTEYEFIGKFLVKLAEKSGLQYKINKIITEKIEEYDKKKVFNFIEINDFLKIVEE